jgi:rfaE bifunctional protein kinase chain/domain
MTSSAIHHFFDTLSSLKLVVVGDIMLDEYAWGFSERMSPEAPVPVLQIQETETRPGGAANVALNLCALGVNTSLVSLVGNDLAGRQLRGLIESAGIHCEGLVTSAERPTTVKKRIMNGKRQLLRIDEEWTNDVSKAEAAVVLDAFATIIKGADAVILQDYDKGVLSPAVIQAITAVCKKASIPIAVDPKQRHFHAYRGVQLFKPNFKELEDGLEVALDKQDLYPIEKAANQLRESLSADAVLLTLSEAGVLFESEATRGHIPAHLRNIVDVSGAGDTVIAVAGCCLAAGLPLSNLAALSNLAGGIVCESVGVVPIKKDKLLHEALLNASA